MRKEIFSLSEKIKSLREKSGRTQAELARELGISRAAVNSWEMGIAAPSTALIIELSNTFSVSSDYLLGLDTEVSVDVSGLSHEEVAAVVEIIESIRGNRKSRK
ncbi:MAG: helix-turn-helix domain-containing protein [Clostridiales Family XIII bacterium]|jgi:transcriptional regulator with XRE-family HTH domain|nr:helix-turn-helix domain-containing protein [Clostridiales Family XIII bacterium]